MNLYCTTHPSELITSSISNASGFLFTCEKCLLNSLPAQPCAPINSTSILNTLNSPNTAIFDHQIDQKLSELKSDIDKLLQLEQDASTICEVNIQSTFKKSLITQNYKDLKTLYNENKHLFDVKIPQVHISFFYSPFNLKSFLPKITCKEVPLNSVKLLDHLKEDQLQTLCQIECLVRKLFIRALDPAYDKGLFSESSIASMKPIFFTHRNSDVTQNTFEGLDTIRRVKKEMSRSKQALNPFRSIAIPVGEPCLQYWTGVIVGPNESNYEGGIFFVHFELPRGYPFQPPKARCINKVWHPNIEESEGIIDMDCFSNMWSPALEMKVVASYIYTSLRELDGDCSTNAEAARMFRQDKERFKEKCAEYIKKHA